VADAGAKTGEVGFARALDGLAGHQCARPFHHLVNLCHMIVNQRGRLGRFAVQHGHGRCAARNWRTLDWLIDHLVGDRLLQGCFRLCGADNRGGGWILDQQQTQSDKIKLNMTGIPSHFMHMAHGLILFLS
jgi:hypothetical protein